jgi:serine/threonine protein kinase
VFGVELGSAVGDYRIHSVVARGPASVVVAAESPSGELVALKLLTDRRGRFERGGDVQTRLNHPAIRRVREVVDDEQWGPVLVMDLVRGRPLSALLEAHELPSALALLVLEQAAAALDYAHAAGVLHGDLKPANVLVDAASGQAWLTDFGIAERALHYLAPEVVQGGPRTAAADRYSLAAIAFTALVGSPVFPKPTDAAVLAAHLNEPPPFASRRRPELPAALDPVLAVGLAKEPTRRPDTAAALVEAITIALGAELAALPSPQIAVAPEPPRRRLRWRRR